MRKETPAHAAHPLPVGSRADRLHDGSYNASSWGQVSGSSAYPNHFVWRGPWFGADFGSYVIKIDLYNGSTAYTQAYTTFSL